MHGVTSSIDESLTQNGIFCETELYIIKGQTTTAVDARAVDSYTGDWGSIPGRYIPKTLKQEVTVPLPNAQHYV